MADKIFRSSQLRYDQWDILHHAYIPDSIMHLVRENHRRKMNLKQIDEWD